MNLKFDNNFIQLKGLYIGCFNDSQLKDLQYWLISSGNQLLTIDMCINSCLANKAIYAGLRAG